MTFGADAATRGIVPAKGGGVWGRRIERLASELRSVRRLGGGSMLARYLAAVVRTAPSMLRERSIGPADVEMGKRGWPARVRGCSIATPPGSFGLMRELYGREPYFGRSGFEIRPGDVVVDLGANAGLFSVLAAKLGAEVVAVEAQSVELERLEQTVEANGCGASVRAVHALVGAGTGLLGNWSAEAFGRSPPATLTMDELVARERLTRIDFLKVDVEGSEFGLFDGSCAWLSLVRRIAMEVHLDHGEPGVLVARLRAEGFETALAEGSAAGIRRAADGCYLYAESTL